MHIRRSVNVVLTGTMSGGLPKEVSISAVGLPIAATFTGRILSRYPSPNLAFMLSKKDDADIGDVNAMQSRVPS